MDSVPVMKARILPELEARHRIILCLAAPAIDGDWDSGIACGTCGTVLIPQSHPYLALRNLVIRCPECQQCNDAACDLES